MTYVCDLTPAEIEAITLSGGAYEIAPDSYMTVYAGGAWSVTNEDGEIEESGYSYKSARAYLLALKASYEG
jgi:hypothetical protein